jgi:RHS repeat-associated protein
VRNPTGHVVRMSYDPLGRRIGKREHDQHGQLLGETVFTWDGLRLLHEQRNSLASLYVYADGSHEPLARIDGSGALQKIRYYHNDLNGLPEQLTESDGHVVWSARYRVWGNTAEEVREPYFIEEQNLRFQGQYLDRETGLHYNTFRFYDPDVGRFTTPDPIGLAGGINLYQYAPNPVGWVDALGLSCTPNKKTSYQAKSRRDAFRQAKRDAGIPVNQKPSNLTRPELMDGDKNVIIQNGVPLKTRQYYYLNNRGETIVIQEHSLGHAKATPGHGGEPHFNVRPIENVGTGYVPGTHGHYNF